MDIAAIVRQGVALANGITASVQADVLHAAWIGNTSEGGPLLATPVSRPAIVEMKQQLRRLPSGQEVMQRAVVTFIGPVPANGAADRKEPIDPRDVITLPSSETGPILDVSGLVDPGTQAPFLIAVSLG